MAYDVPTASELKNRFPAFEAVEDNLVDMAIGEATRKVDATWPEGDFSMGIMLYAAHILTLDGLGTTQDAKLVGFSLVRSGQLTLQRQDAGSAVYGDLSQTGFGRRFKTLVRCNFPGIIVI